MTWMELLVGITLTVLALGFIVYAYNIIKKKRFNIKDDELFD